LLAYIVRSVAQVTAGDESPAAVAGPADALAVVQDEKRSLLFKNEIFALFDLMDKVYRPPRPSGFLRCLLETNVIVLQELEKAGQAGDIPQASSWFDTFLQTFRIVSALQQRRSKEAKAEAVELPQKFMEGVLATVRRWADERSSVPDGLEVVATIGLSNLEGTIVRLRADGIAEIKTAIGQLYAPAENVRSKEGKPLEHYELLQFHQLMAPFKKSGVDEDLVKLIRDVCDKNQRDSIEARALTPSEDQLTHYPSLEKLSQRQLRVRAEVLNSFNAVVQPYLEFVDLKLPGGASLLTDGLRAVRGLIFWSNKKVMYQQALDSTVHSGGSNPSIEINNYKAMGLRLEGKTDWKAKRSTFAQAFRQLREVSNDLWKRRKNDRMFTVRLVGEHAADAGGPYRNVIANFCDELQSNLLPLFIRCPNGRAGVGMNREKWIPNPSTKTPLHLAMYEFLGKFMGLAMRTGNLLDLDLPSIVWKPLVYQQVEPDDVRAVDILSFKVLEQLKSLTGGGSIAKEYFSQLVDYKFEIIGSDQQTYPLVAGGRNLQVTWDNKDRFMEQYEKFRLNEFADQCAAMRRGLTAVIPENALSLLTWQELELLVCGRPTIDVDLWERNTRYEGCSANDRHVKLFWEMVRTRLNDAERAALLRFVWGRSRLPLRSEDFESQFKIASHYPSASNEAKAQDYLPVSHTCFFQLDLPRYNSLDVMHKKMLFAITHCVSTDGDASYNPGDISMGGDDE